jgi:hypothetical protein
MIHKEIDVQSKMKVIVSLVASQFAGISAIDSAIRAMDYAAKKHLRLRGSVIGTGVVLGNVLVLDVNIPLETSNSSDVTRHYNDFNREVVNYLTSGVYHKTDATTYGGFGRLSVGYVTPEAVKDTIFTVRVKTTKTANEVRQALASVGEVQDVRDAVGRFS